MLAFTITVSPDHEHLSPSSLLLEVLRNELPITAQLHLDGRVKEVKCIAASPPAISLGEVELSQVAADRRDGHVDPSVAGQIVLDVVVATELVLAWAIAAAI